MAYKRITVVIPPEMSDCDDSYTEIIEYVAACTRFKNIHDDLDSVDMVACNAVFEDNSGNIWHGHLADLPYPDGSQKYMIDLEKKGEKQ